VADPAGELLRLLGRQVEALEDFARALDAEREALVGRDADALAACAGRKSEAVAVVESLEQQRRRIAPSLADMEAYASSARVAERWERLLELTRRCREVNDANGRMIRRQRTRVDAALGLLRGQRSAEPGVYGPDGERCAVAPGRPPIASV